MKKKFSSPVHVGELVRKVLEDKGLKAKAIAAKMGYTESNFSVLLTRESWDAGTIAACGNAIGINLFAYFVKGAQYDQMVLEDSPVYLSKTLDVKLSKCHEDLERERLYSHSLADNVKFYKQKARDLEIELNQLKSN